MLLLLPLASILAQGSVECYSSSTRCYAYNLSVDAEVIELASFEQIRPLNFGRVTAGENIDVKYSGNNRGKQPGILRITVSTDDYEVRVIPESSNINVESRDGGSISQGVAEATISEEGEAVELPWMNGKGLGPRSFNILIRSSINIPSNAKSGLITGSMRIQVVYL